MANTIIKFAKGGKAKKNYRTDKAQDAARPAKPIGLRIVGDTMRKPTKAEVEKGYALIRGRKKSIYSESRVERSDKVRTGKEKL